MQETKRCITCAKVKDITLFSKNIRTADGRRNECTDCRNIKRRIIKAADYDSLFKEQNGKCAVCGIDAETYGKKFSVDHDHENEDEPVRGLLCIYCNSLIGMASDSVEILQAAIGYIKHHSVTLIREE